MTIVAFDTLTTAETLTDAGIEETHAKAITAAMRDAVIEGVATSADIDRLEGKIGRLEDKMMSEIAGLEGKIGRLEDKMMSENTRIETATRTDIASLETRISESKNHTILAVFGIAGLLFTALKLFL